MVKNFCKIFSPIERFSKMSQRMLPIAFSPIDTRCHGNEIWDKMGYNAACVKIFCYILASIGAVSYTHLTLPTILRV